jgi:hypothetical protein
MPARRAPRRAVLRPPRLPELRVAAEVLLRERLQRVVRRAGDAQDRVGHETDEDVDREVVAQPQRVLDRLRAHAPARVVGPRGEEPQRLVAREEAQLETRDAADAVVGIGESRPHDVETSGAEAPGRLDRGRAHERVRVGGAVARDLQRLRLVLPPPERVEGLGAHARRRILPRETAERRQGDDVPHAAERGRGVAARQLVLGRAGARDRLDRGSLRQLAARGDGRVPHRGAAVLEELGEERGGVRRAVATEGARGVHAAGGVGVLRELADGGVDGEGGGREDEDDRHPERPHVRSMRRTRGVEVDVLGARSCHAAPMRATISSRSRASFGPAPRATWSTSASAVTPSSTAPAGFATRERTSVRMPSCVAARSSGTVDIPTTSAPAVRRKPTCAALSNDGPWFAA